MKSPMQLLWRDLLTRGGAILAVLCGLQFATALFTYGMGRYWSLATLPLMFVAMSPLLAPSRRQLTMLPLTSRNVDRMQWLYGGGIVAVCVTAMNLLAWPIAISLSVTPPAWKVALLVLGTPGTIGLCKLLRRWTAIAVHPSNQARPVVLTVMFSTPVITVCVALLNISTTTAVPISLLLGAGWFALLLFYFSPRHYYHWIERSHKALRDPATESIYFPTSPWSYSILAGLIVGVIIGGVFGWLTGATDKAGFFALGVAAIAAFMPRAYLQPIKLLRTLPWSLNYCAVFVWTSYLIPICTAVLTMYSVILAYGSGAGFSASLLPFIAVVAPVVPAIIRIALGDSTARANSKLAYLVMVLALGLSYAQQYMIPFCTTHPLIVNGLAIAVLAASFVWLRHEIAMRTLGSRAIVASALGTTS